MNDFKRKQVSQDIKENGPKKSKGNFNYRPNYDYLGYIGNAGNGILKDMLNSYNLIATNVSIPEDFVSHSNYYAN